LLPTTDIQEMQGASAASLPTAKKGIATNPKA
jgi:hypothetical protein